MRRPFIWLIVAISFTLLVPAKTCTGDRDPAASTLLFGAEARPMVLQFEPAGPAAVPASLRHERTIEFGYVRLDQSWPR
jgi:hypothetical protein